VIVYVLLLAIPAAGLLAMTVWAALFCWHRRHPAGERVVRAAESILTASVTDRPNT